MLNYTAAVVHTERLQATWKPLTETAGIFNVATNKVILEHPNFPGVPAIPMPVEEATTAQMMGSISPNNSYKPTPATNYTTVVDMTSDEITVIFTVINVVCFVCFCPVNLKSMKLYLNILHHGHPFFGLLVALQGLCILDLLVCLSEAVTLWVEVPLWVCRCQIGTSHTIHLALSLAICSICAYRLVNQWLPW